MSQPAVSPKAPDPYNVLGLDTSANQDEIKRAYFSRVREHPPERDPQAFKRIRAAYEQLNTPEKKLDTDMLRVEPWPESELPSTTTLDLTVDPADVIRAARAFSNLARRDWREDFREVKI
jgi:curved DNA-binding protein CbpA